jgi:hypothetical protein
VGEIISEWWAASNRNAGRDHLGIRRRAWEVGDGGQAEQWKKGNVAVPGIINAEGDASSYDDLAHARSAIGQFI